MSRELRKLWKEVTIILKDARNLFNEVETGEDGFSEEEFEEYIDHNELGLALNVLEGIPIYNEVPREFWQLMLQAANRMNLENKIKEFTVALRHYS